MVVPSIPTEVVVLVVVPCVVVVVETVTAIAVVVDVVVVSVFSSDALIDSSAVDRDETLVGVTTAVAGAVFSVMMDHVEAGDAAEKLGADVEAAGGNEAGAAATGAVRGIGGGGLNKEGVG